MTTSQIGTGGFGIDHDPRARCRPVALATQIAAAVALVLSIAAVIAAMTLQIAEASPLATVAAAGAPLRHDLPIAWIASLALVAIGGLTVLIAGLRASMSADRRD
ncbi:hypothetical protein [Rhodoplanes serenus]|jgi:hypothetical protein|uniref:hypothetical protein n=1 Tax=Rhodoplanes serenus TaxID=200615 RepID=UPI000DACA9B8|nr:hypothetical protein [Rhodoplanes serenus]RAI31845.1 hypothetical protein CH340_17355 [Rhodoplanes serenus]